MHSLVGLSDWYLATVVFDSHFELFSFAGLHFQVFNDIVWRVEFVKLIP